MRRICWGCLLLLGSMAWGQYEFPRPLSPEEALSLVYPLKSPEAQFKSISLYPPVDEGAIPTTPYEVQYWIEDTEGNLYEVGVFTGDIDFNRAYFLERERPPSVPDKPRSFFEAIALNFARKHFPGFEQKNMIEREWWGVDGYQTFCFWHQHPVSGALLLEFCVIGINNGTYEVDDYWQVCRPLRVSPIPVWDKEAAIGRTLEFWGLTLGQVKVDEVNLLVYEDEFLNQRLCWEVGLEGIGEIGEIVWGVGALIDAHTGEVVIPEMCLCVNEKTLPSIRRPRFPLVYFNDCPLILAYPPFKEGDSVLVDFSVFAALGVKVKEEGRRWVLKGEKGKIEAREGDEEAIFNGRPFRLPAPLRMVKGRLFIPVRLLPLLTEVKIGWRMEPPTERVDIWCEKYPFEQVFKKMMEEFGGLSSRLFKERLLTREAFPSFVPAFLAEGGRSFM